MAPRRQSLVSGPLGNAASNLLAVSPNVLEYFLPGFATIQSFFQQWLNIDITKLVTTFFLFGVFSSSIQKMSSGIYNWLTRFLTASVSIPASDRLNREVLLWMSTNVVTQTGTRVLAAQSGRSLGNDMGMMINPPMPPPPGLPRPPTRHTRPKKSKSKALLAGAPIDYYPSFGSTWFWFRGRLFLFRRCGTKYDSQGIDDYWSAPDGSEHIVLLCVGRSPEPLKRFLEVCRENANKKTETFTSIHLCQDGFRAMWDTHMLRPARPLHTVDLDEVLKKDIVADIEAYLAPSTRRFYARRGIPYRRGYLFHGEPGTGKTSFCLALAGYFNLELYALNLSNLMNAAGLLRLFATLPQECIIVLEDIDSAGIQREASEDFSWYDNTNSPHGGPPPPPPPPPPPGAVTLSGLLNALDGLASQEGRVLIMTSNTPDALDKALIRPGRVDRQICFGLLTPSVAESIFIRMFTMDEDSDDGENPSSETCLEASSELNTAVNGTIPGTLLPDIDPAALRALAHDFGTRIPPDTLSPAEVQGFLLQHRDSPATAVEKIEEWIEELKRTRETKKKEKEEALEKRRHDIMEANERMYTKRRERELVVEKIAETMQGRRRRRATNEKVKRGRRSDTKSRQKKEDGWVTSEEVDLPEGKDVDGLLKKADTPDGGLNTSTAPAAVIEPAKEPELNFDSIIAPPALPTKVLTNGVH
ncbi:P-loop containing nucleoside triphosphate hydrolase protein [Pseudovirgaria hyperparasitica]|uniref:P-loop containing nucleoside triphosphate hydrolase protein n=1 Tax=Pseudovirgaria hyperparasitica TaxID=470096 RepID=A0A6A6WEE6_9PEZI|nr:P-loop containing nucleoside triphosphate hydrolase protein [Pseudovirgaria hyperparasitica]KAF2760529.1 P-loop containing nucleoside triphosphate hydrolase protein [Pseudovirgaria hyperparasitica]